MGKSSSSSLKKKRSRISSSQARIKKRSKSRTKRSSKLKKFRRRDDPLSYSSDSDYSRSSVSVSSSTSEDDKRSRRPQSRTRKDVRGGKKRPRRRSSSYESSEDSHRVKRRKGSGRNGDAQARKKTLERKKKKKKNKMMSKREVSVSSKSSGSWSCSTCRGVSGSNESEVEKNRGRSQRRDKGRRFGKVRSGSTRRRSRSRSFSSCSYYSDYGNEEKSTGDVNSRRLRSVVIIAREGSEEREMDKDEHKEEMEYDRDDYPPSRSNDSIDGGSKRELVHSSNFASEEKKNAENERGEEAVVSDIRTGQIRESDMEIEGYDRSNPGCDRVSLKKKNTEDSGVVDSPNAYDLESKLRQKALENLRSFRRGHKTDAKAAVSKKDLIDAKVKTLSSTEAKVFQNKSPKEDRPRMVSMGQVGEQKITAVESKVSAEFSQDDRKNTDRNDVGKESGAEHDVAHLSDKAALAGSPGDRVNVTVCSELNKPRSIVLASRPESSNSCSSMKQIPALQDPQLKSMTGNIVVASVVEDVRTVVPLSSKSNGEEVNKALHSTSDDPSCPKSISGGSGSNKLHDEAKEDSQFEQKTMTVMRGGEMVEVSYKVYIPKRAPALSRRPLKR